MRIKQEKRIWKNHDRLYTILYMWYGYLDYTFLHTKVSDVKIIKIEKIKKNWLGNKSNMIYELRSEEKNCIFRACWKEKDILIEMIGDRENCKV